MHTSHVLIIGFANVGIFEHVAPECSQLMCIVDFNDIELLNNVLVQMQLLFFELWDDHGSKVDGHQVEQFLVVFNVTVTLFNGSYHSTGVALILEQGSHGLLTSGDIVEILLSILFLLLQLLVVLHIALTCFNGSLESGKIVDLTLGPVVQVSESVLEVLYGVSHLILDLLVVSVVEEHLVRIIVNIHSKVLFLVLVEESHKHLVVVDGIGLVGHVVGHLGFEVLQEWVQFLDIESGIGEGGVECLALGQIILHLVDCSGFLHALVHLLRSKPWKSLKRFLDITRRSREDQELLGVDQEFELCHLSEESLKVEASLIDELKILVTISLLRWDLGNQGAAPSGSEGLVQAVELVVSSLTTPWTLLVHTSHFVYGVT